MLVLCYYAVKERRRRDEEKRFRPHVVLWKTIRNILLIWPIMQLWYYYQSRRQCRKERAKKDADAGTVVTYSKMEEGCDTSYDESWMISTEGRRNHAGAENEPATAGSRYDPLAIRFASSGDLGEGAVGSNLAGWPFLYPQPVSPQAFRGSYRTPPYREIATRTGREDPYTSPWPRLDMPASDGVLHLPHTQSTYVPSGMAGPRSGGQ